MGHVSMISSRNCYEYKKKSDMFRDGDGLGVNAYGESNKCWNK